MRVRVRAGARGAHLLDHVKRPVGKASLARVGVGARRDVAVREEHDEDTAAVHLVGARATVVVGQRTLDRGEWCTHVYRTLCAACVCSAWRTHGVLWATQLKCLLAQQLHPEGIFDPAGRGCATSDDEDARTMRHGLDLVEIGVRMRMWVGGDGDGGDGGEEDKGWSE
eukprot:scaffold8239_cov50-Phaeocystis_antarctica.AAC.1